MGRPGEVDCTSEAWLQGHADGRSGRPADPERDGDLPGQRRDDVDGFVTGQTERELEPPAQPGAGDRPG